MVGTGTVLLRASTNYAGGGGSIANGYNGTLGESATNGLVSMTSGSTITSATGSITIQADGNIAISSITSTSGSITISADDDGVTSMSDGGGSITDSLSGEAANIISGGTSLLTLASGSGIGVSDDINTTVVNLTASTRTTGSGAINILESNGLVIASAGVSTGAGNGSIDIRTNAGAFTINGAISANGSGNVTLLSNNGLMTVNAVVGSGSGNLSLTGGTGITHTATGDMTTSSTGTITVDASTGNVTMADGTVYSTGSGAVSVTAANSVAVGSINTTSSTVSVTANVGSITDATSLETVANILTSGTATLTAALGIGSAGAGDIDTNIGILDATVTGAGSMFLEEFDAITLLDVDTSNGAITISAGGTITATDVASANSAEANDIILTATDGNIIVGLVSAGATAADVLLNAVAGNIEESGVSDADADIIGEAIELIAITGIGTTAQLEIDGVQLAAVTTSGNISILDTAGGLDVNTVNVNGDGSSTTGVSNAATTVPFTITIRTSSPLTISSLISNAGGGDIVLAAEGTALGDNLSINADLIATGGNGSISLYAGNSIFTGASADISVVGTGLVLLRASTNYAGGGGSISNGYNGAIGEAAINGLVSMASGSTMHVSLRQHYHTGRRQHRNQQNYQHVRQHHSQCGRQWRYQYV
ncbi:MAG UNVERIFIED_CONTAM: hypothetical protein LVR18_16925 [Planctomycetaceae bacterium]